MSIRSVKHDETIRLRSARLSAEDFVAQLQAHYPRLWLVAAGLTNDRSVAEDIVQDAVMIAWQKRESFVPGSHFAAWLVQIIRRIAANYHRKNKNRRTRPADPQSLDTHMSDTRQRYCDPTAVHHDGRLIGEQTEFDDEMAAALNQLGEEARCCVLLKVVEQLSYTEIAELLHIPAGTAMSHVHRGKQSMRAMLRLAPAYQARPRDEQP